MSHFLSTLFALVILGFYAQAANNFYPSNSIASVSYKLPNKNNCKQAHKSAQEQKCFLPSQFSALGKNYKIAPDKTYQVWIEGKGQNQKVSSLYNTKLTPEKNHLQKNGNPEFRGLGEVKSLNWRGHRVSKDKGIDFHALIVEKRILPNKKGSKRRNIFQIYYLNKESSCFSNSFVNSLQEAQKLADTNKGTCLDSPRTNRDKRSSQSET